jgi:putative redox protein
VQVGEGSHLKIFMSFYLEGDIKEDKAAKAAQLSLRNTVVSKTLEPTATIHYKVVLNGVELAKSNLTRFRTR